MLEVLEFHVNCCEGIIFVHCRSRNARDALSFVCEKKKCWCLSSACIFERIIFVCHRVGFKKRR